MKQLVFFTTFCHESWYRRGTCWVPLHIWSQVSGLSIRRGAAFSHSEWHPIHNHPPHEIFRENIQMCSSSQILVTKIKWRTGRGTEYSQAKRVINTPMDCQMVLQYPAWMNNCPEKEMTLNVPDDIKTCCKLLVSSFGLVPYYAIKQHRNPSHR